MKKLLCGVFGIMGLILLFSGCGKKSYEGKTVTVFGAFADEEARRFDAAVKPFTERTGIKVNYEGSKDFESLIFVRAEGGNPPDVAAVAQPGIMKRLVDSKKIVPLWPEILSKID